MSAATVLTLANGRGIDLLSPDEADVDFVVLAEHLAKEKRFNGATPGVEYSVAEHLARGVDAIRAEGGTAIEAAYYSLHDAAEAVLKDDTTPKKRAIAEKIAARCGVLADSILACLHELEEDHQRVLHAAAGLPWPPPEPVRRAVKRMDLVMFVTEWRDLMRGWPHPNWADYSGIRPLSDRIDPWDWQTAQRGLLRRWRELLPALRSDAGAR